MFMAVENMARVNMSVNYILYNKCKKKKPTYDEKQEVNSSERNVTYVVFLNQTSTKKTVFWVESHKQEGSMYE